MNIVLDTNVFLSALRSADGTSGQCVERCLLRQDQPSFGAALLAEFEEKIEDPTLWEGVPVTLAERRQLLADLIGSARWQNVWFTWRPNLPDPDEDHVYELALAAASEHLVTWNTKDFARGELKPFERPRCVTPPQHLQNV